MKIALLGDIALFGVFAKRRNPKIVECLKEISGYLSTFDYVVGNLETPFSQAKRTNGAKSAYICSDAENVSILKQLHVGAVTLANNHIFDYGCEGYELTKILLDQAGIEWFGTEGKELKIEFGNSRIAFSGYCCYSSNPLRCVATGEYGVNAYSLKTVQERMVDGRDSGYFNIVAVHAGMEHVNYPSIDHIRASRQLAEAGNYVYYGHHPHVIQGTEIYKGSLIAHSLGNFCFDDVFSDVSSEKPLVVLTENNRRGMILELTIENNKLVAWREQIIYISKDGIIRLMKDDDAIAAYSHAVETCETDSEIYIKRRQEIIDKHIADRKAMRNLSWYIKRMRPRYVRMILNARKNARLYGENVLCQITKL